MLIQTSSPPKSSNRIQKYGVRFSSTMHPLSMEMYCIQHGGQWQDRYGKTCGNGNLFHYRRGQEILWPDKRWHKWRELSLEMWLAHEYVGEMGCAAAAKSDDAATDNLFDWYCFPSCTTVLVASTDLPSLDLRVWGMIKRYHRQAKERVKFIEGHLIEGARRIVQDHRDDASEGRDFRNGLLAVPCFPTGTLVDTPQGARAIESLGVGDLVLNASGQGRITETHNRIARRLVRVKLSDGRHFDCTPEHPIFTQRGWVNARDLETFDTVFSPSETMCLMQGRFGTGIPEQKVLFHDVPSLSSPEVLRPVRQSIPPIQDVRERQSYGELLQPRMRLALGSSTQGIDEDCKQAMQDVWKAYEVGSLQERILLSEMPEPSANIAVQAMRERIRFHTGIPDEATQAFLQSVLQAEVNWQSEFAQASEAHNSGNGCLEFVPDIHLAIPSEDGTQNEAGLGALVPDRYCLSQFEACRGNRWRHSPNSRQTDQGQEAHRNSGIAWVDSVEVLESRSDSRFDSRAGGYSVHNIEVDSHPSYSVNRVVVHNCKKGGSFVGLGSLVGIHNKRVHMIGDELQLMPRSFIDSISNLSKCEHFRFRGIGNPNDTANAHGFICEPSAELGGWEGGVDQRPGTKTWETRMPNGVAIQKPGSDSPNMDVGEEEPVPFPFLMTRQQMKNDAQIWGIDDWHFTMMNEARMPRGQGSHRILTRNLCEKSGALMEPNWRDTNQRKISFLDAAYRASGGDRCVFGEIQFGAEAENDGAPLNVSSLIAQSPTNPNRRMILALIDLVIIPITAEKGDDDAEDQIVKFVMAENDRRGIRPSDFFYDAGMKTTLVTAFSRNNYQNAESVDFGGKPSEEMVSTEIQKRACDYYSKKVTELWYAVRLCVEAKQFRGLTKDAMWEFCAREFKTVSGNRIELETKEDMKLKTGKSPDLADAVAVGLHGALRRGFVISKLGKLREQDRAVEDWKAKLTKRAKALASSGNLIQTA